MAKENFMVCLLIEQERYTEKEKMVIEVMKDD